MENKENLSLPLDLVEIMESDLFLVKGGIFSPIATEPDEKGDDCDCCK